MKGRQLAIRTYPDHILRQTAKVVAKIDASTQRLIDNMLKTVTAAKGIGLAAPQVGKLKRIIVVTLPDQEPLVLINPVITKRSGERNVVEGCLSIPDYQSKLKRPKRIRIRGLDREGQPLQFRTNGQLAQVLDHEVDHLDGVLMLDHEEVPQ